MCGICDFRTWRAQLPTFFRKTVSNPANRESTAHLEDAKEFEYCTDRCTEANIQSAAHRVYVCIPTSCADNTPDHFCCLRDTTD